MTTGKPNFINGEWISGGADAFSSTDAVTGEVLWHGSAAGLPEVTQAVRAARVACDEWSSLPVKERIEFLYQFKSELEEGKTDLALAIAQEVGKPKWEALTEVNAMIGKIALAIEAFQTRTAEQKKVVAGETIATRYKPHGVVAVFGPYNFPGHLANGHIVPALLAGNTVVFKQSELAPLVGQKTVELWQKAGLPAGVINLLQGGRATGEALAQQDELDGLFFTGSANTGRALARALSEHPEKILALEMGGNNPLSVTHVKDLGAAAYMTVLSAFQTAGQRCTCARRLIVPVGTAGDDYLAELQRQTLTVKVGHYSDQPEPFMGPVITVAAADQLLQEQEKLLQRGAKTLLPMRRLKAETALLSPGILDVTKIAARDDTEFFGPLLQVIRVPHFEAALLEANATHYGLAAGLISDDAELYELFFKRSRAGIVNWNRQLTGASSSAPFGGIGLSGNHRPSAYFAADYCSYPVASMEAEKAVMPATLLPGIGNGS